MLLFSEDLLHGCTIVREAVAQALPADAPECRQVGALARRHGLALLVGFIERDGDLRYNSQLIAGADGSLAVQRKYALNGKELANGLARGSAERVPFTVKGRRCHIAICADWGAKAVHEDLDRQRCEVVFLPTAGGGTREQMLHAASLAAEEGIAAYAERMRRVAFPFEMIGYCLRNRRAVVACNSVGDNGFDMCQEGHCVIMAPTGELLGLIPGAPFSNTSGRKLVFADV